MTIDEEILQQVVNDVCSGMLGLEMEPSDSMNCDDTDALSAVIRISGGWDSLVQVLTPRRTAVAIASTMFDMGEDQLTEAEIRDAVGEIVNMVGGNLKGIVECESSLSLPCVGESVGAAPFDSSFSGLTVSSRCQGDPMIVRLLDRGVTVAT
ncbi:MAG: chemotaxis protein CheX [Planctomycetaceae bacterium]|nr:chemotaxis protein CheX [Planctomycetaceae bacterium]